MAKGEKVTYGNPDVGGQIEIEARQCWATPDKFVSWLAAQVGQFTLDPCAVRETTKAPSYYGPPGYRPDRAPVGEKPAPKWLGEDGLIQPWGDHRVFCNPGFNNVRPWLMAALAASREGAHVFVLTHCSTAQWFREFEPLCKRIWLPYPRINFDPPAGIQAESNPRDSMIWEFKNGEFDPARIYVPPIWDTKKRAK